MDARASFDRVAELYDAMRPAYPPALFADLAATVGLRPGDPILEVGCGSGQATVGLAGLGGPVVAVDPGADLVRLAARRLGEAAEVRFVVSTFEAYAPAPHAARLVASAQAWHWVDPAVGFVRAAEALAPDGWIAIFGHVPMPPGPPLAEAFAAVYARVAPEFQGPSPESAYLPTGPVAGLIEGSGLFGPVVHRGYAFTRRHTAASFGDLFGTISYYNAMDPDRRQALVGGLMAAIDAQGGVYDLAYETHLYMAPRRG